MSSHLDNILERRFYFVPRQVESKSLPIAPSCLESFVACGVDTIEQSSRLSHVGTHSQNLNVLILNNTLLYPFDVAAICA